MPMPPPILQMFKTQQNERRVMCFRVVSVRLEVNGQDLQTAARSQVQQTECDVTLPMYQGRGLACKDAQAAPCRKHWEHVGSGRIGTAPRVCLTSARSWTKYWSRRIEKASEAVEVKPEDLRMTWMFQDAPVKKSWQRDSRNSNDCESTRALQVLVRFLCPQVFLRLINILQCVEM